MDQLQNNVVAIVGKPPVLKKKIIYAVVSALFFVAVSLPDTYKQTSRLTNTIDNNCPTAAGKFIHTAVFFILNFVMMKIAESYKESGHLSNGLITKYAFSGALLFFVVSSSDTYRLTSQLFGEQIGSNGCPTVTGIAVHGVVFAALLVLMMSFPKDRLYPPSYQLPKKLPFV